jgi:hypothetical protein
MVDIPNRSDKPIEHEDDGHHNRQVNDKTKARANLPGRGCEQRRYQATRPARCNLTQVRRRGCGIRKVQKLAPQAVCGVALATFDGMPSRLNSEIGNLLNRLLAQAAFCNQTSSQHRSERPEIQRQMALSLPADSLTKIGGFLRIEYSR